MQQVTGILAQPICNLMKLNEETLLKFCTMHYRKRLTNLVEWRNHTEILYNALQEKINKPSWMKKPYWNSVQCTTGKD